MALIKTEAQRSTTFAVGGPALHKGKPQYVKDSFKQEKVQHLDDMKEAPNDFTAMSSEERDGARRQYLKQDHDSATQDYGKGGK